MHALDGIAIDLPRCRVKPTHGEYFPLNIQVKEPALAHARSAGFHLLRQAG